MPADFTGLNAAVTALTAQVQNTEGTEASAIALINGFSAAAQKAVADALTADDAADNGSIQAANDAIAAVTARFVQSGSALGAAVAAGGPNTPPPPPPPPPPTA
jgi:hypothetical protein